MQDDCSDKGKCKASSAGVIKNPICCFNPGSTLKQYFFFS